MTSECESTHNPHPTSFEDQTLGSFGYGLGLSLAVLLLFVAITYASYKCHSHQPRPTTVSTTTITMQCLDEATLSSYPQYTYSQLKPHKGDSAAASGCSICLSDYKDGDFLRLLPECGHLFHRSCLDEWLKRQPTCPICRNSPFTTPIRSL